MKAGRFLIAAGCGAVFAAALYSQGCGDNGTIPVDFEGNVSQVEPPSQSSIQSSSPRTYLVRLHLNRLYGIWGSTAEAQSGTCSATTQQQLQSVLACVLTGHNPEESSTPSGSATPTRTPTVTIRKNCSPVSASDCTFSTRIELEQNGDPVIFVFAKDNNQNGQLDESDTGSILSSQMPQPLCNGDVIDIPDVDVNFQSGVATAGGPVTKRNDACPAGTPTHTPTPTTPEATVTGTPPTATPTTSVTPEGSPSEGPTPPCSMALGECFDQPCCAGFTCNTDLGNLCVPAGGP